MSAPHGPWRIVEVACNCIEIQDGEGRRIAQVFSDTDDFNADDREIARLISAAPDLLAALEAAHRHMESTGCHPSYLEQQRAALAKARAS